VALELVERVASASTRDEALEQIFSTLRRYLGFDCASVVSLEGAADFSLGKPELCRTSWTHNAARYLEEGRPVLRAAIRERGVIQDRDVLCARERERLTFYEEYMRPAGATSFVMFLVQSGRSITQLLSLSRAGATSFSAGELSRLRTLGPAVSLAARAFSGAATSILVSEAPRSPLTVRENEIVHYLVRGLRNPEIAACIGTSRHTVRNQIQSIFSKLDVSTRAELVAVVLANGWARGLGESECEVQARLRQQS
jgi:DNA-binding NarL/FixJ family response regulator